MMNKKDEMQKRIEIMGEALQTALEAILEIQAEHKLINYILDEENTQS